LGKAVAFGKLGILQPNITVESEEKHLLIDGVRFVFHNVPGSEAPSEFVFYLPDFKAFCGAEIMGHTLHNLYTLRGAKVRDATKWASGLGCCQYPRLHCQTKRHLSVHSRSNGAANECGLERCRNC
jgi:alkyl sulfatase BDS1-like metallo-beta-lactamase superfamily hydrolase